MSDAQPHTNLDTWNTDPFSCALSAIPADCQPSFESALDVQGVAWTFESFWLVDRSPGSDTWLIELDDGGNMLRRIDISAHSASPGGLGYDWRLDTLVLTDTDADLVRHFDLNGNLLGTSAIGAWSTNPTGISQWSADLFLVSDADGSVIYEFELGATGGGVGAPGVTNFVDFNLSTLTSIQGVEWGPDTGALYVLDTPSDSESTVYVFYPTLVPEPGTGALLGLGLAGLAARRRARSRQRRDPASR